MHQSSVQELSLAAEAGHAHSPIGIFRLVDEFQAYRLCCIRYHSGLLCSYTTYYFEFLQGRDGARLSLKWTLWS